MTIQSYSQTGPGTLIYFNRNRTSYPLEEGYWYKTVYDLGEIDVIKKLTAHPSVIANYRTVFVLESWAYSPHTKLFLGEDSIQQRYEQNSRRREVEAFMDMECLPVRDGIYTLYKCQ